MVDAGRLEDHPFVGPPHGPVHLPHELAVVVLGQQHRLAVPARADVRQGGGLVVIRGNRGQVLVAPRAVGLVGVVVTGGGAVIFVCRTGALGGHGGRYLVGGAVREVRRRRMLPGRLALRLITGEDRADPPPFAHREEYLVAIRTGCVALGLADPVVVDAQLRESRDHRGLEMLGPVRVAAAGRRRYGRQRLTDVLGPGGVDARRNPAEPVIVVPGQQVHAVVPAALDLIGHQVRGHHLAQVSEVDRPGRAEAGSAHYPREPAAPRCGDHLVREVVYPVDLAVLSHDRPDPFVPRGIRLPHRPSGCPDRRGPALSARHMRVPAGPSWPASRRFGPVGLCRKSSSPPP